MRLANRSNGEQLMRLEGFILFSFFAQRRSWANGPITSVSVPTAQIPLIIIQFSLKWSV